MVILPLTIFNAPVAGWEGMASFWAGLGGLVLTSLKPAAFRLPSLALRDGFGLLVFVALTFSLVVCPTSLFAVFRLPIFAVAIAACFLPLRDFLAALGSTVFAACG